MTLVQPRRKTCSAKFYWSIEGNSVATILHPELLESPAAAANNVSVWIAEAPSPNFIDSKRSQ